MATRAENLARIRFLLDTPMPSRPSFAQLFQLELSSEVDVLNASNNTGRPWAVNTFQLNYSPGQSSYEISATDFGKPIFVTRIVDSPYISRIMVPFNDLNDQQYGTVWQMWSTYYGWPWNISETPERMSFFRSGVLNAQPSVTIEPQPQESVSYEISYIPAYTGYDDPLESSIQLPEMSELVQLRTAMSALPYAAWFETEPDNSAKRKELAMGFQYQLSIKEPIFKRYLASIVRPRDVEISSWCDSW